jgi:FtsZ-binding cell division protein ZapB
MNDFTPDQNKQIKTWASERDSLTSEIASKREENESLKKSNSALVESNTDLSNRILVSEGRIKELNNHEKDLASLISLEVAELEKIKTKLQSEVSSVKKEIESLENTKNQIIETTDFAVRTYEGVFERTQILDGIFSRATQVNDENVAKMNNLMIELNNSVQKLYNTNEANVEKANYYINELSKIFFVAQKTSPIKKIM